MGKIVIPQGIGDAGLRYLAEHGHSTLVGDESWDRDRVLRECADCDALIARFMIRVDRELIDAMPCCRVVSGIGVGTDHIDVAYATKKGIRVTNAPRANVVSVAEGVIGLMLQIARSAQYVDRRFRADDFNVRNRVTNHELRGKTIGLIGCGNIARESARIAVEGFRMKAVAYDPFLPRESFPPYIEKLDDRSDVFTSADFVCIQLHSTAETRHSIGMAEFRLMKPEAYLINCSRGDILVESELIEALKSKLIGGAGIDVFEEEPAHISNPLFSLDNVVLMPHAAGATQEAFDRGALLAAASVDKVLNGLEPEFPVNSLTK